MTILFIGADVKVIPVYGFNLPNSTNPYERENPSCSPFYKGRSSTIRAGFRKGGEASGKWMVAFSPPDASGFQTSNIEKSLSISLFQREKLNNPQGKF